MILSRYFAIETLKFSSAIIFGLFAIYISTRFASYLGSAAEGKIAADHIYQIVLLKMVLSLKDLIPMSLFIGTFAAATRLQSGSEWTAMKSSGMGHQDILKPLVVICFSSAILVGVISLGVGPRIDLRIQELQEMAENEATIAGLRAGKFKSFAGGTQIFYADSVSDDGKFLLETFVRSQKKQTDATMRAQRATLETNEVTRDRFAIFENGVDYDGRPGSKSYTTTRFDKYALRIENREPRELSAHTSFLYTSELFRYAEHLYSVEFHWRLAAPICTFFSPFLACLIALGSHRGAWYLGLITAISSYFAYINCLGVGRALMRK